jgi:tripartite-type tricarboxylate transporter receptor subunit TctC
MVKLKLISIIALAMMPTFSWAAERVSVYNRMPLSSGMGLVGFDLVKTMNLVQNKYEFTYDTIPGSQGEAADQRALVAGRAGQNVAVWGQTVNFSINPVKYVNTYDRDKDFIRVYAVTNSNVNVLVNPDSKITTMEELAKYLKSKPTAYTASSVGSLGTILFDAVFRKEYNITNVKRLNYDSAATFTKAVLGGEADYTVATAHDTPALRAISTTNSKRNVNHPDVSTGLELGLKDFNYDSFHIIYVPKERKEFAEEIVSIVDAACKHPNVQTTISKFNWFQPACSNNRKMIDDEITLERRLVEKYKDDLIFD